MPNLSSHKKALLLFLLVNLFSKGYSQNEIAISVDNKKCPRCDCVFFQNDSIIFKALSDSVGYIIVPEHILDIYTKVRITINNEGRYYLRNSRQNPTRPLVFSEIDLDSTLKSLNLNEVVVYAKRNTVEDDGDKLVYNAYSDPTNASSTTVDILRKAPMVTIDMNCVPSIRGSQNVKVLVNNREVSGLPPAQIIEQIPSGDIKKIEVITTPGAKYDAEGTSGIINIITHKNIYFKNDGYMNLGIGTKGSHLFANYSYLLNNKWTITNSFYGLLSYSKTKGKQLIKEEQRELFSRESEGKNEGNLYSYQFNISRTTDKEHFDVYLNYYLQKLRLSEEYAVSQKKLNESDSQNGYSFYKIAIDYARNISNHVKINLVSNGFYLPISNEIRLNKSENKYYYSILNSTSYLDMTIAFSRKFNLDFGFKSTLSFFNNSYGQAKSSSRQILSATYFDATYKINNKTSINAGTRYENYLLRGLSEINKNYNDLFFAANINYKFNNKSTLTFLFSKRTQRPSYSNILPIENYISSNIISIGNPNLNRELGYNYEIGFSKYIGDHFIKLSPFYKYTRGKISNYLSWEKEKVYTTYINVNDSKEYGASLWTSLTFLRKRLSVNYGIDVVYGKLYYNELKANGVQVLNSLNMTCKIGDSFYINLFGTFNTARVYLQGKENSYTYSNLSVQKNFNNGNFRIALSMDNPFAKGICLEQKYNIGSLSYNNKLTYYNRGIRLLAIYKFGKKQNDPVMKMQDDILTK